MYDFGNNWEFTLQVEKTDIQSADRKPRVLEGKGLGIIEDCGGMGWIIILLVCIPLKSIARLCPSMLQYGRTLNCFRRKNNKWTSLTSFALQNSFPKILKRLASQKKQFPQAGREVNCTHICSAVTSVAVTFTQS
ncbi:MAG: hypothetical protein J6I53_00805 [Treponema sp.]|nr:hypothetical protein [Treponema sp.]